MAKSNTVLFWCAFAVLSGVAMSIPLSPCLAPMLLHVVHMVACMVLPCTIGCMHPVRGRSRSRRGSGLLWMPGGGGHPSQVRFPHSQQAPRHERLAPEPPERLAPEPASARPPPTSEADAAALQTLWELNASCEPQLQLGRKWDIDFLTMQITPSCLQIFSKFWQVGGSFQEVKDFEGEFEVCSNPWTIRIKAPSTSTDLADVGKAIRESLTLTGPTCHPILAPPGSVAGCRRVVAKAERMVSAQFLANALEEALAETDCELLIMRYGMKLPAEDLFPLLLECRDLMAVKHGALFSRKCWNNKVLDFGTQNVLSMQPILVRPKNNLHEVPCVNNKTLQSYSSFGKLGGGYGGVQFLGTADGPCQKVTSYVGKWMHQIKAAGAPPAWAPFQCSNQWFTQQWAKFLSLVEFLDGLSDFDVAGHRMELRVGPESSLASCVSWEEQLVGLERALEEVSQHLLAKPIPAATVLERAKLALGQAEQAGLFRCQQGHLKEQAPPHKRQDYNRLAHHFGFVNKYNHRHLFKLCSMEAPWGPEGRALEEVVNDNQDLETPTWSINPFLPKGITKIFIEETMVPADVQAIGQTYGDKVDWIQVAEALGQASCSTLLQNVATSTKWRRMMGKKAGSVVQFACTVQGKVHGPLGPDLVMATVNLIARGLHLVVSKNDLKAHPAANQGHAASCASMPSLAPAAPPSPAPAAPAAWLPTASVPLEVHQAIKTLRAQFVHFLKAKVQEMDGLHFNALIEDDHFCAAFLDAKNKGQDPTAILDMALKAECDSGPGHVCYFGPIATEFFRDALGLDCMITSTDELSMTGRLSKPLAVVHHDQHWVPMWSKSVFGPFQSRPTLPLHCYDLYVERYGPVAEKVHAYVDCTCMAAGDCAIHSLLILSDLQRKAREPPEGERFGEWTLAEQAILAL